MALNNTGCGDTGSRAEGPDNRFVAFGRGEGTQVGRALWTREASLCRRILMTKKSDGYHALDRLLVELSISKSSADEKQICGQLMTQKGHLFRLDQQEVLQHSIRRKCHPIHIQLN